MSSQYKIPDVTKVSTVAHHMSLHGRPLNYMSPCQEPVNLVGSPQLQLTYCTSGVKCWLGCLLASFPEPQRCRHGAGLLSERPQ